MVIETGTLISIVLATVVGVAAVVAPLYYMVLKMYGDDEVAAGERADLGKTQENIQQELENISSELDEIKTDVRLNAQRSEANQKHIHQLLLGKIDDDDSEIGNPHYHADHCPIPDECPFHEEG